MTKGCFIVFPNQLFKEGILFESKVKIFLVEEDLFFNQFNFHKQKILFHRSTMKFYENFLLEKGLKVEYIDSYKKNCKIIDLISDLFSRDYKRIEIYDPEDYLLLRRIRRVCDNLDIDLIIHESKLFLNSKEDLNIFFKTDKKKFFQTSFYKSERKKRNILINEKGRPEGGEWTYDIQNRKKYPKNQKTPSIIKIEENSFVAESINYVNKYFPNNYGELSNIYYPTTFEESENWLSDFLKNRFKDFGDYEDSVLKDEILLNHSLLSPLLNVGLLDINFVISQIINHHNDFEIPINSTEGLIRQIIGWREFIRGIYVSKGSYERKNNFWEFKRKIPPSFYDGSTGIDPVDICIKKVLKYGYLHHIERLMIIGNFMLLCEFDPDEVYKWFMELFIDSYDWVMVPNVYGMSQFADGGLMSTKPYISSSNYLFKMSDFKKGDWVEIWDGLFWRFMDNQRIFFQKNPRLRMLINTFDKMDSEKKNKHLEVANNFLKSL